MTTAATAMPAPVHKLKKKVTIDMCVMKRGTYIYNAFNIQGFSAEGQDRLL